MEFKLQMTFLLLVTLTSMLLAAIMSVIAWRTAGEERRRSEARVAALAADIHGAERVDADRRRLTTSSCGRAAAQRPAPTCSRQRSRARRARWPAVLAAGAFVVVAAVAVVIVLERRIERHDARLEPGAGGRPAAGRRRSPLELVALGHERDGDRLTVRGIVRNPESGAAVDRLDRGRLPVQPRGRISDERPRHR